MDRFADPLAVDSVPSPADAGLIKVAAVVLLSEAAALTVRKRSSSLFQLPGGKAERGETWLQTAIRECREETGIELDPRELTYLGRFDATAANEPGMRVESTVYLSRVDRARLSPTPQAEIAELRWTPLGADPADLAPLLATRIFPALIGTQCGDVEL
ncbi:8-oxo-dGTP pyrophosphatase MutT (NUDIX family) [Rarobacter incanus]|uniref:8-oxo-dGTP pyrophosphatase MutT (NUDIX family) n=2 Tax=Rarobacter incanus TaxID=153494 RepID=A0A542SPG7_9MICO|nr:8-oxo-dGTP pyrophosphatase MutT (NUDIX family) [Rarobacter incanus]